MAGFNGWKNWETWNVSLWVQNTESWYASALRFMRTYKGRQPWRDMVAAGVLPADQTPDGASLTDPKLSLSELNCMMRELVS